MTQSSYRLKRLEKVGYGFGDVAINISMMSASLILTFFYTDIFGLNPSHVGLMFLIVRVLDAFADVGMGWLTDRIAHSSGRYRFWIGVGAIPFGLSVYLVFANPELSYEGKLIWAYVTYTLNSFMFTLVTIPYVALLGSITDDPQDRLSANGYRFVLAKAAVLLVTSSLTYLATMLGGGDKAAGFASAMMIMAAISSLALLFSFFTTKERVPVQIEKLPFGQQLSDVWANDQWRLLALCCVFMMAGFLVRGGIAFHYAIYILGLAPDSLNFSIFMSMWSVGGITATMVSTLLTARFCKIKVLRYSLFAAAAWGCAMYLLVPTGAVWAGIGAYFVFCLLSDINTPVFWASIADVVDYGEEKLGRRVSGIIYGTISFLQKAGMGIAGFLVGSILGWSGYVANAEQSPLAAASIALMMWVLPAVLFAFAGTSMTKYLLNSSYFPTTSKQSASDF